MRKWSSDTQFPTDTCFQNRVLKALFSPSKSSDNPMVTLEVEVVVPTVYNIGGEDVDISGVKGKYYITTTVFDAESDVEGKIDMEKTKRKRKDATAMFKSMGIEVGELDADGVGQAIDWNNINPQQFEGKMLFCKMSSNVEEQRATPTVAELAKAKADGTHPSKAGRILTHPITGKKLVNYYPRIEAIYGAVPA